MGTLAGSASAALLLHASMGVPGLGMSDLPFALGSGAPTAVIAPTFPQAVQARQHHEPLSRRSPTLSADAPTTRGAGLGTSNAAVAAGPSAATVVPQPQPRPKAEPPTHSAPATPAPPPATPETPATPPSPSPEAPRPTPAPSPPREPTPTPTTPPPSSGGPSSSPPPSEPPPPPPGRCVVALGSLTVQGLHAVASTTLAGCVGTDLRLTLAAYKHDGSRFLLLASVTQGSMPNGTSSSILTVPECSTDVVLLRGLAPATSPVLPDAFGSVAVSGCTSPAPPSLSPPVVAPEPSVGEASNQANDDRSADPGATETTPVSTTPVTTTPATTVVPPTMTSPTTAPAGHGDSNEDRNSSAVTEPQSVRRPDSSRASSPRTERGR
jgi:hypothetical protein